jgi:hypothetical protein
MMNEIENPPPEVASNEPCAYCGARPTWPVVWKYDDDTTYTVYLCAQCDGMEIMSIEEDEI